MGIYIKSMGMPGSCLDCPFVDYFKRRFYCPVINDLVTTEVHGRDERCGLLEIQFSDTQKLDAFINSIRE